MTIKVFRKVSSVSLTPRVPTFPKNFGKNARAHAQKNKNKKKSTHTHTHKKRQ